MSESDTNHAALLDQLEEDEGGEHVEIDRLNEHPVNEDVYGETDPEQSFVDDIERNGVETPVVVNEHEDCPDTIIGGHRRTEAARRAGFERVPVRWVSYPEPEATQRVILNNKQREKSAAVKAREATTLEQTSRKLAKENNRVEGNQYTGQDGPSANLQKAHWDDDVAEQVGVSARTIRKGTDVLKFAYPDEYVTGEERNVEKYDVSEEVREVARKQAELMDEVDEDGKNKQSFHGAHVAVQDAIDEHEREQTVESISESVASDTDEDESIDVSVGDVWELGDHILYCGNTASDEFQSLIDTASFAFADPPYAAGVAEWDDDESEEFDWQHDWLHDVSDIVAVTPGIVSIFDFAERTTMPYRWSVATWIKNGGARGELGFGNWIYTALFADDDTSLYRTSQDVIRITLKAKENDLTEHKGQKPSEYMAEIVGLFSEEEDTIIDPFAGSGSTLFAAEEMDRTCITGDLEPTFCAEIIGRWNGSHPEDEAAVRRGDPE